MQDVSMQGSAADAEPVQLVLHYDNGTPFEFVVELLRAVFGKSEREASTFTWLVGEQGSGVCGTYPPAVAKALLDEAEKRIRAAGHSLRITREAPDPE